jgi:hypothetical protein
VQLLSRDTIAGGAQGSRSRLENQESRQPRAPPRGLLHLGETDRAMRREDSGIGTIAMSRATRGRTYRVNYRMEDQRM